MDSKRFFLSLKVLGGPVCIYKNTPIEFFMERFDESKKEKEKET